MSPKLSVIMPVCNVESYLAECLDSALSQSFHEIEIICINDGSTDRSLQILREYEKKDPRVKVIDKANAGYGAAMNDGLDAATGEYVGILESDDYACEHAWEKLYTLAKEHDLDMSKAVTCNSRIRKSRILMLLQKWLAIVPISFLLFPSEPFSSRKITHDASG